MFKLTLLEVELFEFFYVNLSYIFSLFVSNFPFDDKRLVVCRFLDSIVKSDKERWPFTVICGPGDEPMI